MTLEYRVQLDVYNGPLDLLLYLIRRDELDITDIPIARITDSYISYINMLRELSKDQGLDINVAGDFLVMAATLMEAKSAMLLPKPPPEPGAQPTAAEELADPRYELVQKLLEYKRFKDAAMELEQRQATHGRRFARYPASRDKIDDEPPPVDLDEVQVWDLLAAFTRLMSEVGQRKPRYHEVIYDDTPIDLHAADIADRVRRERRLSLRQLMEGRRSRSEMIGLFLALLELIREKKVIVRDDEATQDIIINDAPEEHQQTYSQASLGLAQEPPARPEPAAGPDADAPADEL
jgi:segregation and condensation protein A